MNTSKPSRKPKITDYIDFRLFLKDFFTFKKGDSKSFSQRQLAARLSISSPSFMSEVIGGKKKLSQKLVLKLADVLQITGRDFQYFELLVKFNQSRSMEEKNHFFQQLSKFRSSLAKTIHENQYEFYTTWYHSAVWNYFGMNKDVGDPARIAREIFPAVTVAQVNQSIRLLLDLGLIEKLANGYGVTQNHIVTEDPFRGMVANQFNQVMLDMAKAALNTVPGKSRQYNMLMFSISEKGFKAVKERIRQFQEELRDIIEHDSAEDRIYSLAMQLFPNSRNFEK